MMCSPSLAWAPEDQADHVAHHRSRPCRWDMSALPPYQAVMVRMALLLTTAQLLRTAPDPLPTTTPLLTMAVLLKMKPPACLHLPACACCLRRLADLRASEPSPLCYNLHALVVIAIIVYYTSSCRLYTRC